MFEVSMLLKSINILHTPEQGKSLLIRANDA
jgi:hypothetical protein